MKYTCLNYANNIAVIILAVVLAGLLFPPMHRVADALGKVLGVGR